MTSENAITSEKEGWVGVVATLILAVGFFVVALSSCVSTIAYITEPWRTPSVDVTLTEGREWDQEQIAELFAAAGQPEKIRIMVRNRNGDLLGESRPLTRQEAVNYLVWWGEQRGKFSPEDWAKEYARLRAELDLTIVHRITSSGRN